MISKFRNYIEHGSWEEHLEIADEWLTSICWAMLALALVVFGPAILHVLIEAVTR